MIVYLLTETQKELLIDQLFDEDSYFNPIQDIEDNWIISKEEINQCTNKEFEWIKDLPQIQFNPKPPTMFIITE
jgi:hypothetical protein